MIKYRDALTSSPARKNINGNYNYNLMIKITNYHIVKKNLRGLKKR